MPTAALVSRELKGLADPQKKKILQSFFKTGPGQYGEGDLFLGVTVPQSRLVARKYAGLDFPEIRKLMHSPVHEERLAGLMILVFQFQGGNETERGKIFRFYLKHAERVNNWDLVDLSADKIVGAYLRGRSKSRLYRLARSRNLWRRRIAIVATLDFIRAGRFKDTTALAEKLMGDSHDLIHKACGWMLRETGKRDSVVLEIFLKKHCRAMPRTMLRYAIERLPAPRKRAYMKGQIS